MKPKPLLALPGLLLAGASNLGCSCEAEPPSYVSDLSIELSPKLVVDTVGAKVTLGSELIWKGAPKGKVDIEPKIVSGDSVSDLTGAFSLDGRDGNANEAHIYTCVKAGKSKIQIVLKAGGRANSGFATIECLEPKSDAIGDHFYSISTDPATFLAKYIDVESYGAGTMQLLPDEAKAVSGNTENAFEIVDGRVVVRREKSEPLPAGEVVVVATNVVSPVPQADPGHSLIYSVVFDSDGFAANDWQTQAPYDWDQFQSTDRWYQATWDFMTGTWKLDVTQVQNDQSTLEVASRAQAVISDDSIVWFIPRSELSGAAPTYRVTTFGHDGKFSPNDSGGDVSGANPTQPLDPL